MATSQDTQSPPPSSPVSVMISYSRTDSAFVDRLQRDLEKQGLATWIDRREISGAPKSSRETYDREIRNAIDSARVVLVVISPASVESRWVRQEYTYALQRGKRVIPVLHYGSNITPAVLAHLQSIDLRTDFLDFETSFTQQLKTLVDSIHEDESPEADIRTLSVMISYSHEDRTLVDRLQRDLDGRGFLTWV